ncbi:L-idonate 5-dehydrogenase [Corynebacterium cystitidis]|uniref:L-idonate 5-dehydrogenase n=1 Tax=Corynebacterium cystitidis DSM 20524 TaxID=1121357 RepID=A0A1H9RAK7_9CORY|nr:L-idonate 5-dehydrogenase [Corynebacterium cystitidis]WJY81515.1 L-idonate 5-dehydrogenase (NAD(P)(+)) [Corynebacterium cystitidis DSM 20524]SER69089.1 L-idonate 5-dehydrogenase [Corynebacterium cystitidis DSM 20524]SNV86726.1 Zinc-binding alcohol dehydrogenase [Corynebacterium cystitidis]
MKAVTISPELDLQIVEVDTPDPGPGEVRVRMEYGGVCGSDIAYWKTGVSGTATLREPLILGHEMAGVVDQLGTGIATVAVGDRVTFDPATLVGDYEVSPELARRSNLWPEVRYFGSAAFLPHEQGGFSTYRVVREDQIYHLPENVSTREAAATEPLAVAIHAVQRSGDISGKKVLVNGCGPIGSLIVAAAKHYGASEVWAADLADTSLHHARAMGADHTVNVNSHALPEDMEVAFDASGAPAAIGGLLMALRRGATLVQVGNLPSKPAPFNLGQLVTREINYIGSYRFTPEVIPSALQAMASGLDVTPILTHEFPIDQAEKAFETAADRSTGSSKVLLKLS